MTSFIIASTDQTTRKEYLTKQIKHFHIDPLDVITVDKQTSDKTVQSIGIETVKYIKQKIFFKPLKSEYKCLIIEDAQLLTTEAQNALLKLLEEPPDHTYIFLETTTKEVLLPTILSRCQLIELQLEQKQLSENEKKEYEEFLAQFPLYTIGERLKKAELLAKDKEQATIWIEKLILVLREKLLETNEQTHYYFLFIKSFHELHTLLKTTNVNTRFAIENTFLTLIY